MPITLKICEDQEEWDELVDKSPYGTIFHTWKFLKIMEKHTPSKLYPLIGLKGTTLIGVYPLFYQRTLFLKMIFSPPPHCAVPYLGPLILDYNKLKQSKKESIFINFQKAVDDFVSSELNASYISISTSPGLIDSRPLRWQGYEVEPKYNYIIDLKPPVEEIWIKFKNVLRNDIKRTERKEVVVEEGMKEDFLKIYRYTKERYSEQKRVVLTKEEYLSELYDSLNSENLRVFIAKYNGEYAGGVVLLYHKNKVIAWVGTPKSKLKGLAINDLLQWDVIKKSKEGRFSCYEEMGANTERLCYFKSKYNPELEVYFSAKKYLSSFAKITEFGYLKILKPVLGKIR